MDTDINTQALEVLRQAEQSLRQLISKAALEEQYDQVAWIVELARQVSAVRERNLKVDEPQNAGRAPKASTASASVVPDATAERRRRSTRRQPSRRNGEYPKFRVDQDRLVKTGWSKKNKDEYEHRAPKEAVQRIFEAISKFGEGDSFDVDAVAPLIGEDEPIPSYQIYMAIGWLRSAGYLEKCGRNDYASTDTAHVSNFEDVWEASSAVHE